MRQPSRLRNKGISRSVKAHHEVLHRYNKVKLLIALVFNYFVNKIQVWSESHDITKRFYHDNARLKQKDNIEVEMETALNHHMRVQRCLA